MIKISKTKKAQIEKEQTQRALAESDKKMARIGEDILDVLISKGVLQMTDLPESARATINERKSRRGKL